MPQDAQPQTIDPLAAFLKSASRGRHPIPLVSTALDVEISGGLAIVTTARIFRNVEAASIEATLSFPVPVQATLFALEATIGGRRLRARAERRKAARATYEKALDEGKASVLHEEVLRGIHMLSVAPIGPDEEIKVVARWVTALACVREQGELRIPLTVGHVYGVSPLPDSDALLIEGPADEAELTVRVSDGSVALRGGVLTEGRARVPLNAPVDLIVTGARPARLVGTAADGRQVALTVRPGTTGDGPLDVAVLVDRSGSMGGGLSGLSGTSQHQQVVAGLARVAPELRRADSIDLWEFDTRLAHVGGTDASPGLPIRDSLRALVARLGAPRGGTEIGEAIRGTLAGSAARDLLLVTDGQSYALDVQALAGLGRRISVVLVGEGSLEANVGHLAALTGGDLFVAADTGIGGTLTTAFDSLRVAAASVTGPDEDGHLITILRNAEIEVEYREAAGPVPDTTLSRAVAALAASIVLPSLPEARAAALAEAEGLVTHLTSLVIVDEVGEAREGIPSTRKVPLPLPGTEQAVAESGGDISGDMGQKLLVSRSRLRQIDPGSLRKLKHPSRSRKLRAFLDAPDFSGGNSTDAAADVSPWNGAKVPTNPWQYLVTESSAIMWGKAPGRLAAGDLEDVPGRLAKQILGFAVRPEIVAAAERIGLDPLLLILALLARTWGPEDRAADRLARSILRKADPIELARLEDCLRSLA